MVWNYKTREKALNSKKISGYTNQYTKAKMQGLEIPQNPRKGKPGIKGRKHSEETKNILRIKALASNHRRLKKNVILYNNIYLDSKWELYLAKKLDNYNIEWIRPDPIKWVDENNIQHNYFPDFYLPKFKLFLDPKNPHAHKVQENKINILLKQHSNIIILNTIDEIDIFIDNLISLNVN